jgi:CHAD domain-containing protein
VKASSKTTGLRYWMLRVLGECDRASAGFHADPVHDLRVSLRRCRSMADGMMAMDPDPSWKAMKKAGKRLFQSLGELRDVQIMMQWIEMLRSRVERGPSPAASLDAEQVVVETAIPRAATSTEGVADFKSQVDGAADTLLHILQGRETQLKLAARGALDDFDRKQWRQWSKSLPVRAARIRPGSAVFKHLALERWTAARELHSRAMRVRSQVALHTLRIGIKRFRYIVENFLPVEHKLWSNDLKHMQDLLGEVHDFDVLWATALSCHVFSDEASRKAWHEVITKERTRRVDEYRQRMTGPDSLWTVWRAGLPQGKQIQQIATRRMKLWAKVLDPDFVHSERVSRLALELYDGLESTRLLPFHPSSNGAGSDARSTLYLAALLHDVGRARDGKRHHKESQKLIHSYGAPLGWNPETMQRAAVVARFHSGALPTRSHKVLRDLLPEQQKLVITLSAILRLANALDANHDGSVRRVRIDNAAANARQRRTNGFLRKPPPLAKNEALIIGAEGYTPTSDTAQAVAAERHLLEIVLRRPVIVRAGPTGHISKA